MLYEVITPPVMHNDGVDNSYDIEVREFKQQILPGGIWNTINGRKDKFNPTRIWSYGPAADPTPKVAPDPNRITSYNVCYTKLLRTCHKEKGVGPTTCIGCHKK